MRPTSVLHVGAHDAEEDDDYRQCHWGDVTWVEALPDKAAALRSRFARDTSRSVVEALAWSESGVSQVLNVANNGMSSSVFGFGTHSKDYPSVKFTGSIHLTSQRLDEALPADATYDLINLDIQGAELHALIGLGSVLDSARWIYTEVNEAAVYEGCPLVHELDALLADHGFVRIDTVMTDAGWGDALYIRQTDLPKAPRWRRFGRRAEAAGQRLSRRVGWRH